MISRKKKNGFTLIELLVVIALMLSILGIAIVSFINISNKKKQEAWEDVKAQIETAATEYFTANEYLFEGLGDISTGTISVGKLVTEDYINKITDPRNGKVVSYCSLVNVTKKGNKLEAKYEGKDLSSSDTNEKCDAQEYIVYVSEPGAPSLTVTINGEKHGENNEWYNGEEDSAPDGIRTTAEGNTNGHGKILSLNYCKKGKDECSEVVGSITYDNKKFTYSTDNDRNYNNNQGNGTISYTASNSKAKAYYEISYKLDNRKPTIENFSVSSNNSYYTTTDNGEEFYVKPSSVRYANPDSSDKLIVSYEDFQNLKARQNLNVTLDKEVMSGNKYTDGKYTLLPRDNGLVREIKNLHLGCNSNANFCLVYYIDHNNVNKNSRSESISEHSDYKDWKYDSRNKTICHYKHIERGTEEIDACLIIKEFYGNLELNTVKVPKRELFRILPLPEYDSSGISNISKFLNDEIKTYNTEINGRLVNLSFKANDSISKISKYSLGDIKYIKEIEEEERDNIYKYFANKNIDVDKIFNNNTNYYGNPYKITYSTDNNNNNQNFNSEKNYNREQLKKIKTRKYKITNFNNVATDASENITKSLKNVLVPGYLDGGIVTFKVTVTDKAGNKSDATFNYEKYMECGSNTKTIENNSPGLSTCAASSSCGVYGTETPYTNYSLYTYDSVTGARCSATNYWSVAGTPIENSSNCAAFYYACPSTVPGITTQTCTATTDIIEGCGNDGRKRVRDTYSDCRTNEYYRDCSVKEIELDLNTNAADASEHKGMGGVGPDSSTGKGPIFKSGVEGVAKYSCEYKRGMDVDVSCSGYRKYAASSCMNVYDFERRFKYRIKWDDYSYSEYRYANIPIGSTRNNDTKFEHRKSPITVNLYEDTSNKKLKYDCKNNGNINISDCGNDSGWTPNVTKHIYYVSYGNITSNGVALYTKYFANCGY